MVFLRFILLSILFSLCICAYADNNSNYQNDKITETKSDISALDKWEAGTIVSEKSIEKVGAELIKAYEKAIEICSLRNGKNPEKNENQVQ